MTEKKCDFCGSTPEDCAKWKREHPERWHTYSLKQLRKSDERLIVADAPFLPRKDQ